MINKDDIKKLSSLARIKISTEEEASLASEIDGILSYVNQIQSVAVSFNTDEHDLRNVLREDELSHEPGIITKDIITQAPDFQGSFIKVKKIL